jgi:hypothetical protein
MSDKKIGTRSINRSNSKTEKEMEDNDHVKE